MAELKNNESHSVEIDEVGLLQIDTAVFNLFSIKKAMSLTGRKVPVLFGSWERFAQMQGNTADKNLNDLRDNKGMLRLPIISIRRDSVSPNESRFQYKNIYGEPSITFSKKIATASFDKDRRVPFTSKWQYGNAIHKQFPVFETYRLPYPNFINIPYVVTFWASYIKHVNIFQDMMWNIWRKMDINYKGFFFYSEISGSSDESNLEDFSSEERIIKYSFNIDLQGYILNKKSVIIDRTVSEFQFEERIIESENLTELDSLTIVDEQ